jgi:hypothetical protein
MRNIVVFQRIAWGLVEFLALQRSRFHARKVRSCRSFTLIVVC